MSRGCSVEDRPVQAMSGEDDGTGEEVPGKSIGE